MNNFPDEPPFVPAELEQIFNDMDEAFEKVAEQYGFHCRGCEDNCCLTRFYHHTWAEYFYLRLGFLRLAPEVRESLKKKAESVIRETEAAEKKNISPRVMCPLNSEGLCSLYGFRPMICRLHGMAHELHPPGKNTVFGPGCEAFSKQTCEKNYIPFDRTPFYTRMARLESELKQALGIQKRIRMTVAEMVINFYERNRD